MFHLTTDRHFAGVLAGHYFTIETYLGLGVSVLAIMLPGRARFLWGYFATALLVINEWGVRHLLASARVHGSFAGLNFGAWHGVSAIIYVIACLAILVLVWKQDLG